MLCCNYWPCIFHHPDKEVHLCIHCFWHIVWNRRKACNLSWMSVQRKTQSCPQDSWSLVRDTYMSHIIVVQLPSCIQLFTTPLTVACQDSLSLTILWSLLKFMSIASVMPSNYLILYCPSFCLQPFPASESFQMSCLLASGGQSIGASASASVLPMSIQGWFPLLFFGVTIYVVVFFSFNIDQFDPLPVQGTLKSFLQYHSSKESVLLHSAYFMVQFSEPHVTTRKTVALTVLTFVGKVTSLLFYHTV